MLRNITALRQGLKAIDVVDCWDSEFETARDYYSLFPLGPMVCLPCIFRSVTSLTYMRNF